jgi:hypothetical protein
MPQRLREMSDSLQVLLLVATTTVFLSIVLWADARAGASTAPAASGSGIYRLYCGHCHALKAALAAGFGQGNTDGGPSFNQLRVSYAMSIQAVTEPTGGHEKIMKKIAPRQLVLVARYIAAVTKTHPIPAFPTDG